MSENIGQSPRSDIVGGGLWIAFGAVILGEALRMDRFTAMGSSLYTMPGFVPGMVGGLIMLLGAVLVFRGWRRNRAAHMPADAQAGSEPMLNRRVLTTFALSMTYAALLIGRLPFGVSTAMYVAAFIWIFSPPEHSLRRRLANAAITGVATAVVVVLVFEKLFLVTLP